MITKKRTLVAALIATSVCGAFSSCVAPTSSYYYSGNPRYTPISRSFDVPVPPRPAPGQPIYYHHGWRPTFEHAVPSEDLELIEVAYANMRRPKICLISVEKGMSNPGTNSNSWSQASQGAYEACRQLGLNVCDGQIMLAEHAAAVDKERAKGKGSPAAEIAALQTSADIDFVLVLEETVRDHEFVCQLRLTRASDYVVFGAASTTYAASVANDPEFRSGEARVLTYEVIRQAARSWLRESRS